ncbi:hypothetical protein H7097_02420 [Aeromicrobium sp.]|nr:hypothetical protein [Candidatus Saccharibacteria bacterium]
MAVASGLVGSFLLVSSHALTGTAAIEAEAGVRSGTASVITDTLASGGSAIKFGSGSGCTVSATLVNSCRPWLGAAVGSYAEVPSDTVSQFTYHEQRIGRKLDIVHSYHGVGSNTLSTADKTFINRANTMLMTNWKPASSWSTASGGNATVNAAIDQMAASIKSAAPNKVMLSVFHEPENDVSPGGSSTCGSSVTYKGSSGTTTDYVNMWHNVRSRFEAAGVTNVVWVMNYMGFNTWKCMVKDLWPGNNYVDWLVWDPYVTSNTDSYSASINNFYSYLTTSSDASHDFASKPWGLNEWGVFPGVDQPHAYTAYDNAKAALDSNTFPKLKMFNIFDIVNIDNFQVNYTAAGIRDDTEQSHYSIFANDPRFTNSFYP